MEAQTPQDRYRSTKEEEIPSKLQGIVQCPMAMPPTVQDRRALWSAYVIQTSAVIMQEKTIASAQARSEQTTQPPFEA